MGRTPGRRKLGPKTRRRLTDQHDSLSVSGDSAPYQPPALVVNLDQFAFLQGVDPELLGPRGSGYTKAVKSRRYRDR